MKKRFFALTVALVMLIAMALPFMATANDTGEIVLTTGDARSFAGLEFRAYRVYDRTDFSDGTVRYDPTLPFVNFYHNELTGDALITYIHTLNSDSETTIGVDPRMRALSEDLLNWIRTATPPITPAFDSPAPDTPVNSITLADLAPGYYFITGQVEHTSEEYVGHVAAFLALVNTDSTLSIDISPKWDQPTVEKRYVDLDGSAAIGTVIPFEVSILLPLNLGMFDRYILTATDTMTRGLTYNYDPANRHASVEVRLNATNTSAIDNTDQSAYTVAVTTAPNGFDTIVTVDFEEEYILSLAPGTKLFLSYSATLNEHALNAVQEIIDGIATNSVVVEYTTNPWDHEDTGKTPPEEVPVYTTDINVFKFYGSRTSLGGADFVLSKVGTYVPPNNSNAYDDIITDYISLVLVSAGSADAPAVYRVPTVEEAANTNVTKHKVLTSPPSGEIQIRGLGSGAHFLYETMAPATYQRLSAPIEVDIVHKGDGVFEISYSLNGFDATGTIEVENRVASLFPETGGIGRTILYVGGIVVMAGAGAALLIRRRVTSR